MRSSGSASVSSTTPAASNEDFDPEHGPRAASLIRELEAEGALPLTSDRVDLLATAVALHADGQVSADPTIGVCWDADRLHLPRVGIDPDPSLLLHRRRPRPGAVAGGCGAPGEPGGLGRAGRAGWSRRLAVLSRVGLSRAVVPARAPREEERHEDRVDLLAART